MPASIGRLKKRPEFLQVARRGRKWVAPGLVLQAWARARPPKEPSPREQSERAAPVRFGVTASRKVGGAVQRNRAKRRLRAVALEVLPVAGRAGYDYVLIARAATLGRPYRDLVRDLESAVAALERSRAERRSAGRGGEIATGPA